MSVRIRKPYWLALALLSHASVAGCCCQIIVPVQGAQGGPNCEFHSVQPTYRAKGAPNVDQQVYSDALSEAPGNQTRPVAVADSEETGRSNPFRPNSRAAELPVTPWVAEFARTKSAPAKTQLTRVPPAQPTPTTPPALEEVPRQPAPTKSPSRAPAFVAKNVEFCNFSIKHASEELPVAPTLTLAPPANASADRTAAISRAAASTGPALNQPKLLPLIEDAQPIALKAIVPKWQPPKYIPNAITATALIKIEKPPAKVEPAAADVPPPARHLERDPAMSNRIEQHLMKNLQL